MSKDWDYIAGIEKAVKEKYGDNAIHNPKANWDEEKEQQYIQQVKERAELHKDRQEKQETIQENGFLIKKKLVTSKTSRICPVKDCKRYSFNLKDDVYMNKFECCYECYIKYVEGREELWTERKKVMLNDSCKT